MMWIYFVSLKCDSQSLYSLIEADSFQQKKRGGGGGGVGAGGGGGGHSGNKLITTVKIRCLTYITRIYNDLRHVNN